MRNDWKWPKSRMGLRAHIGRGSAAHAPTLRVYLLLLILSVLWHCDIWQCVQNPFQFHRWWLLRDFQLFVLFFVVTISPSDVAISSLFFHLHSRRTGVSSEERNTKRKLKCARLVCMCEYVLCNVHVINTDKHKGLCISCAFIRMTFSRDSSTQRQTESTHPFISLQSPSQCFAFCSLCLFFFSFRAICGVVIVVRSVLLEAFDPENFIQQKFKPWNNHSGTVTEIERNMMKIWGRQIHTLPQVSYGTYYFRSPFIIHTGKPGRYHNGWSVKKNSQFSAHIVVWRMSVFWSMQTRSWCDTKKHFYFYPSILLLYFYIYSYSYLYCSNVCWIGFTQKALVDIDYTKNEEVICNDGKMCLFPFLQRLF